jgi:hypothetical protein
MAGFESSCRDWNHCPKLNVWLLTFAKRYSDFGASELLSYSAQPSEIYRTAKLFIHIVRSASDNATSWAGPPYALF